MGSLGVRMGLLLLLLASGPVSAAPLPDTSACINEAKGQAFRALSARDGSSIVTAEGIVVTLAGVVAPGDLDGDPQAASRATETLHRLVAGKNISVTGSDRDRYGRVAGQVTVMDGGEKAVWVQAAMVAGGEARVAPHTLSHGCALVLLRAEGEARARGQGIWSSPLFAVHAPDELQRLTAAEGRFMLVEGVIRRVGESGGRIYMDFGRRFHEDFSVIVPRDAHKAFTSSGIDLRMLNGARVRVRGVVVLRGGPAMELRDPAAMERLKADGA